MTRAADFWAFGCVIYQMLAGRLPTWIEGDEIVARKVTFHDSLVGTLTRAITY